MLDAYIYGGLRSPFGRHGGALARLRPDDLAAQVTRAVVDRYGLAGSQVEDVLLGCTCQAGEDARNVARHVVLLSGLGEAVPGQTVNRLCASGLAAVLDAARAISCGEGELYLAGGVESMSRAPFVVGKAEQAFSRDFRVFDSAIGARFPNPLIGAQFGEDTMAQTADNVAREYGIGREDSDAYAARSQARYARALAEGFFAGEITPVEVSGAGKALASVVSADEHPRPQSTAESLAKLRPLEAGGVTTAGNASGINDGAAVLLVGSRALGERLGIAPLARILAGAAVGVAPRLMGIGPALAIPKAAARAGVRLADLDVIEINEAFAAQVLGCLKLLDLPFDEARVNPNGGAIAIGHPLGASGARLALTAARQLVAGGGRYAAVSLCIGVGQGLAVILERA
ncbi:MAG: 3-oxoadipyl-CoA thiolase [Immundisolibacter sp.]|uniref:3-oxoadipyl-CoA thiolase n=1 Tax=Immundisolibacter sp. TaxID=1934948 RepID=UPI0019CD17C9|nr:3-oxoadipyl-CoA thiolase [Immundisolibacter sp.]MBC7161683.1 3-oxoadipyl-CoA thiolase [Immundisolibacter sp.]